MASSYWGIAALVLTLSCILVNSESLGSYGVNPDGISVSGISAGGAFASQFHVAFSSQVKGAGIIAGLPYHCAEGSLTEAELCMYTPYSIPVNHLITYTENNADSGDVDPVSNMEGSKVFIYDGTLDTVVLPAVGKKTEEYYTNFGADIETEYSIASEHCMPTEDYGNGCKLLASPFISKCEYNAAYETLNHIYGNLQKPTDTVSLDGDFYEFDQTEFYDSPDPSSICLDTIGYVYVPSNCTTNLGCNAHFAFHGCEQGRSFIDDEYARNAGYNEVGELNDIIIVYPQVTRSLTIPYNPNGCFDWWGYTTSKYDTKTGPQMVVAHNILDRILSSPSK